MLVTLNDRKAQTIQTHNAVTVAPSAWSDQVPSANTNANGYFDCLGFDQISITLLNDAVLASNAQIHWSHDGVNRQGQEDVPGMTGTNRWKASRTTIKAKYAKVSINNGDAAAHTISAWAYLLV